MIDLHPIVGVRRGHRTMACSANSKFRNHGASGDTSALYGQLHQFWPPREGQHGHFNDKDEPVSLTMWGGMSGGDSSPPPNLLPFKAQRNPSKLARVHKPNRLDTHGDQCVLMDIIPARLGQDMLQAKHMGISSYHSIFGRLAIKPAVQNACRKTQAERCRCTLVPYASGPSV